MDLLTNIENVLAARSTDSLWRHYSAALSGLGFPYISYYGVRILQTGNHRIVDDRLFLTNCAPLLLQEILSQGAFASVPMYRWLTANHGCESWDWMQQRRLAGRLSEPEQQMLDLFARHGHVSGYAISLSDSVQQLRAGVIMSGRLGMPQSELDLVWQRNGRQVEALTRMLHLRLASIPFDPPRDVLTQRQREVLEQIAVGRTTQEIAALLEVTRATVEKHLRLARKSLGARTTPQAILLASARRQIFVDPGEICVAEANADGAEVAWSFKSFAAPPPLQLPRAKPETPSERIARRKLG